MKSKKIIAGLLALTFVFGGVVLPSGVVSNSLVASASSLNVGDAFFKDDTKYGILSDDTVEIRSYSMIPSNAVINSTVEYDGKMYTITKLGMNALANRTLESVTIPDTVTVIGDYVFSGCNIKSITIPDTVVSIGKYAFASSTISSIVIPDSVKSMGISVFERCNNLKSAVIPGSIASINERTFFECTNLESVTLNDGLRNIGKDAFNTCNSLKSIEMPSSVEKIDDFAFYGCTSLKSLKLNSGLRYIGGYAFLSCDFPQIEIPDSVEEIGNYAFELNKSLKSVILPKELKTFGYYVFYNCSNLESVNIPDDLTFIPDGTFHECVNLKSIIIPVSVTTIGNNAFTYFDSEKKAYLPIPDLTISCYSGSYAEKYAKENGLKYQLIKPKLTYPTNIKVEYNQIYHQVRLTWDKVEDADRYGIALYLAGKWRVQTQNISPSIPCYITPKNSITPGKTYKVAVAAKVNGKWDTENAIKHALTLPIKDSDHDDFLDFEDPDVNRYNYINIDDSLIDDINSIYAKNPKITQSDLDKMIGHVTYRQVLSASRQNSFKKNELVFTRTRKKDYADGVFTLSPSKNSDFAFTITNPDAKMSGGKYSDDDYNMSVKIYYFNNDGDLEEVSPVDINISHNNTSTSKTYVYALEEGIGYIIYVNNETNNYVGEYEIHVSEDNWVYAPNGGIRTREFDILTDHNIEKEIFFSDNTFFILEKAFQGQTNELNQDDWKKEELLVNTSRSCETKWNNAVTVLSNFDNYVGDKSKSDLINKAIFGHDYTGDLLSATSILVTKFTPSDPVGIGISVAGIVYSMGDIYADYKNDKFKSDIVKAMLEGNYNISLFERSVYSKIDPLHITMKSHSVETWEYNHYINKYKDGQRFDVTPFNVYELTIDGDTYKLAPIIN